MTVSGSLVADFFVLRAPLLPLEALTRWAEGVGAPAACAGGDDRLAAALTADRVRLQRRLAAIAADPQIADGVELTSPDLADGVARWRADPTGSRARSAERSLVRYVTRTASRPDLFGLASGYMVGRFTAEARFELPPRTELQVRMRVDAGLLQGVVRRAAGDAGVSNDLLVRRNGSVYRAGGRSRVAARQPGSNKHRLVATRITPAIELALETAGNGNSVGALVAALGATGKTTAHAFEIVRRLLASDMLLPVAQISVTGPEPTEQALAALDSLPGAETHAEATRRAIAAVSSATRASRQTVDAVASALGSTGVPVNRRRCLQVDARWRGEARLPPRVLAELRRSVNLLRAITPPRLIAMRTFKEAFERRFATRPVPLLEALDPDSGIRLTPSQSPGGGPVDAASGERRQVLLRLLERGRSGDGTVELSDKNLAALSHGPPAVLPGAFAMLVKLTARDAGAIASGEFQLVEPAIVGPSGARLLGRLCRGDVELENDVREHLRRESALDPAAIFAELSVTPETDAGLNLSQRPVLREWEIEYGGISGAPRDRRLDPSDLMVSVEDDEVVIHSAKLGRRIVPCSTTATNDLWISLPAARFMLSLAHQRSTGYFGWSWGELVDAPELPRVTRGRTVLALRRWNVSAAEFVDIRASTDAAGFRRLQRWRLGLGIPRLVAFDHPKRQLLVDFDNVLSVDAFLDSAKRVGVVRFVEAAEPEHSPLRGPDGHHAHELIVPLTASRRDAPQRPRARRRAVSESRRRFTPGTEWLYASLYGPTAAADRVLIDHVGPLVQTVREAGLVDRWFFVRYADPGRHLRVRFHGRPRDLTAEVLPALHDMMAPALAEGLLYRVSLDTYEREIERYGGSEGVELMEQAAELDSDAALEILRHPVRADERRHLTVASLAALYADAGLSLEARHACCVSLRIGWAPRGRSLGALLSDSERSERRQVEEAVAALESDDREPRIAALRRRSPLLTETLERLRTLCAEGIVERPFEEVIRSLAHMGVNRLLLRGANYDEVRVHDALARLYKSEAAQARSIKSLCRPG